MLCSFDDLDRSVVPNYRSVVRRQRYLRYADASWIEIVRGTDYLENRLHDHREVLGKGAVPQVDVHKGIRVPAEPSGLKSYSAAPSWPLCAVCRSRQSSTWREVSPKCYLIVRRLISYMDTSIACHKGTGHRDLSYSFPVSFRPGRWCRRRCQKYVDCYPAGLDM